MRLSLGMSCRGLITAVPPVTYPVTFSKYEGLMADLKRQKGHLN